jgi:nickel/cobalt transporter (NiCoT) family protein
MRQNSPFLPALAVFDDGATRVRPKVIGLYAVLIAANLLAWACAFTSFHSYPTLLATALIAYGFGLRHAVDADHIAAIDNVVRKLMQEGKRPIAVGFFFSLGHSTVVVAASCLIALTASDLQARFPGLIEIGDVVGTSISALFLFAIAAINLVVMAQVYRLLRRVKRGGNYAEAGAEPVSRRAWAARPGVPNVVPADLPKLADVPPRASVRARL